MGQRLSTPKNLTKIDQNGSLLSRKLIISPNCVYPKRLDFIINTLPIPQEISVKHAWNVDDKSSHMTIKCDDKMTCHRYPAINSTDCIRGKIGYTDGIHLWKIYWPTKQRGTHAVVGVATKEAPLHCFGYNRLVGNNNQSWGWDLCNKRLYHNTRVDESGISYPSTTLDGFIIPDDIFIVLDMDRGTLAFIVDGQYLGIAFHGLKDKTLFPIVSAVWGHCEITINYIGGLEPGPLSLMGLCRQSIRRTIDEQGLTRFNELDLPRSLIRYLLYRDQI